MDIPPDFSSQSTKGKVCRLEDCMAWNSLLERGLTDTTGQLSSLNII